MNECIGEVQCTKFLGVVISHVDYHLNRSKHIYRSKNKGIGIINRNNQFVNK